MFVINGRFANYTCTGDVVGKNGTKSTLKCKADVNPGKGSEADTVIDHNNFVVCISTGHIPANVVSSEFANKFIEKPTCCAGISILFDENQTEKQIKSVQENRSA